MKKKSKIIACIICMIGIIVGCCLCIPKNAGGEMSGDIIIKDGEALTQFPATALEVKETGEYILNAYWWPDEEVGFITGMVVKDSNGNVINAVTGQKLQMESTPKKWEAGIYTVQWMFLTNNDQLLDFAKEYIDPNSTPEDISWDGYADGTFHVNYMYSIADSHVSLRTLFILMGVGVGLCIAGIIKFATIVDDEPHKYDERQLLVRGKAYTYGFFTMFTYFCVYAIIAATDIHLPVDHTIGVFSGVLIGSMVAISLCIWGDAYFALNEKRKQIMGVFFVVAILNAGMVFRSAKEGQLFVNGQLGDQGLNLLTAIFMVYILIVLLLKSIADKKEEAETE